MSWLLIAAVIVAGTFATLTDWLFMGVLFHERYHRYPEVWWPDITAKQGGDRRAIIYSSALTYVTAAGIIALCAAVGATEIRSALLVSTLAWLAGPLVVTVTNGFWVKIDPMITLMQSLGHLARMLIAGLAAALVLP
jgi:hypothetical protein